MIRQLFGIILAVAGFVDAAGSVHAVEPISVASRREPLFDDALIESMDGSARLKLHHPRPRETAIKINQPWEGNASGYATVFQDGDTYRMYYRGNHYLIDEPPLRQAQSEAVCCAESQDEIHWDKPMLGLFRWPGADENNIIWMGRLEAHNFVPFKNITALNAVTQRR